MFATKNSIRNESLLQILELRQKMISENLANAETPGYKVKSVVFEEELEKMINKGNGDNLQLSRTHEKHLPLSSGSATIPYKVVEHSHTTMNNNRNNVDVDKEMANLANNQLAYNYMIDRVSGHYNKYKKLFADLR
ncbi:flagellar basal body rod protein FlgB [Paenibacillus soyae]|uniref:Flagellar basal body rod protein FlgB n=1 Tax=Paenibacillus soyae TaxID=2969249 RepID=A0A9X2MYG3_9BACL|nr:flagellar basal body rod protein FlgB [Paenibacillus soyae]MCR2805782.1 flagellar basal body rod protein FlgB [Paenibacillus soyae]